MLTVECPKCGKTLRGGDEWSGRSGKCPKCGAIVIFPDLASDFDRAEIAERETGVSFRSKVAQVFEFPNLGRLKFIVVVAATGVSLWVWYYLIIVLAYGRPAYNAFHLRVYQATKHGIYLNNGDQLNFFWNAIFMLGFLGLWYVLVQVCDEMVGRSKQKLLPWSLILLAGGLTWYSILHIDEYESAKSHLGTSNYLIRNYTSALFAIALVGALTYWRMKRSQDRTPTEA
jgi:hypothetical protein